MWILKLAEEQTVNLPRSSARSVQDKFLILTDSFEDVF